jgi:hypothetical protein
MSCAPQRRCRRALLPKEAHQLPQLPLHKPQASPAAENADKYVHRDVRASSEPARATFAR